MLEVVWATGTRCGSEFLIQLTRAALRPTKPDLIESFADLTPGRRDMANPGVEPKFNHFVSEQRPTDYFTEHRYRTCKIEHPGVDLLAVELMTRFPTAKFLSIVRPIDQIVRSHRSVAWGYRKDLAVHRWVQDIVVLNFLKRHRRLLTVSLEDRDAFNAEAFCDFLHVPVSSPILRISEAWLKVNSADRHPASDARLPDSQIDSQTKAELVAEYPIIPEIEDQYVALLSG
jgi:hypothetical protein